MPARTSVGTRTLKSASKRPYICPSCLVDTGARRWSSRGSRSSQTNLDVCRRTNDTSNLPRPRRPYSLTSTTRLALSAACGGRSYASHSSLASTSAINAPSTTPAELRELHQELVLLQSQASSYVDLSRLQLALRSLEREEPVVRIALLGLGIDGLRAARRLARVLLSDPLNAEETWEKELLTDADQRSLLVRYGEYTGDSGVQGSGGLVQSISVPSPLLRRLNLEVLVTTLSSGGMIANDANGVEELKDSILVPPLTMPNSAAGRVGFVRYPVHKAIIVAEGVSGAVGFGRLPHSLVDGTLINTALNLPLRSASNAMHHDMEGNQSIVDIDLAAHGLELFRKDQSDGAIFSNEWQASGVSAVSDWLATSSLPSGATGLNPAVEGLLRSVLGSVSDAISASEEAAMASSQALTIQEPKRASLQTSLSTWSEESHRDLQVNLETLLALPTWRRTTWWRLFWRIDEVSICASDVLRRGWLVEAEQSLAFLSGRMLEAGVANEAQLRAETSPSDATTVDPKPLLDEVMQADVSEYKAAQRESAVPQKVETVAELWQLPPMLAKLEQESGVNALFDPPWPQTVHLARQQMLHQLVPALHRKAQGLLLSALSTAGGSGLLAGWLVVASSGTAVYEAGAIAALGLVWSLRRLQTKWGRERSAFVDTAREDGRRVLADVESRLAGLIRDGGRTAVQEEDRRNWADARAAVTSVEGALSRIGTKEAKSQSVV